jgi:glycosyltransferase involved in cell wall biosynthesis
MIARWSLLAISKHDSPDVLLVGTDPVLSLLIARFWKLVRPRTKIAHWCFDLYPEAAIADGLLPADGPLTRFFKGLLRPAYRACSLIADIGPCMSKRLMNYPSDGRRESLVPWALDEPSAPLVSDLPDRDEIFGNARLALLYSGSFGRAHSYEDILDLAEMLAPEDARVAFSIRGNRESELRASVKCRRLDIRFVPFAPLGQLRDRLACADVHVVSLRPEWTGMVVPSKFFGALSAGRPVLFSGSVESSIALWIREFRLGWVLDGENTAEIASQLIEYSKSTTQRKEMNHHCFEVYQRHFSRGIQLDQWDNVLRSICSAC